MPTKNYSQTAVAPAGDENTSSIGAAILLRQWYLSPAPQNKSFCRGLLLTVGDLNIISYLTFACVNVIFHFINLTYNCLYLHYLDISKNIFQPAEDVAGDTQLHTVDICAIQ